MEKQTNKNAKEMKKVRFGLIGTNTITDKVLAGAREDERFEVTAVCSRTKERAEEFAARHNIPHTFTSLEDMAKSPDVDAIYIATPNALHASQSILCMKHGKHVLCEKPLASNANEVRRMIEAANTHNVVLMEAMRTTVTPNFKAVMQNLSAAGTIRRYFAAYCQYSSRYDRYKAGELPNAFNPELSNGAVMDIGIYTIYPLVVLFGKPDSIQATSVKLPSGVDGEGSVLMRYKNGMDAVVLYSKIADSTLTAEIQGEAGTIQLSRINVLSAPTFYPRPTEKHGTTTGISWAQPDNHDHYYHEVSEFMDVILNGQHQSTLNSHQNSLTTIEIIDEIRRQSGIVYPADAAKS